MWSCAEASLQSKIRKSIRTAKKESKFSCGLRADLKILWNEELIDMERQRLGSVWKAEKKIFRTMSEIVTW